MPGPTMHDSVIHVAGATREEADVPAIWICGVYDACHRCFARELRPAAHRQSTSEVSCRVAAPWVLPDSYTRTPTAVVSACYGALCDSAPSTATDDALQHSLQIKLHSQTSRRHSTIGLVYWLPC